MRKDMILGMSIGGIVLAIVVVYLTITPSHKTKAVVQLETGGVADSQGDGDPMPASDRAGDGNGGHSLPRVTAHTGSEDGSGDSGGSPDATLPAPLGHSTEADRHDSKWGDRLFGQATPLMGTAQTPGARPESPAAPRETLAMADHVSPAPGQISTGSLGGGSGNTASASPATRPAEGQGKYTLHRVAPGESFSSIALAAYGSASFYPHILRANPGLDPRKLKPGITINLPRESDVKPTEPPAGETTTLAAIAPGAPLVPPASSAAAAIAVDKTKQYQVKSGDNLHRIAIKLYGKISMVQPIYEANKQLIGPDMAKLKLGMLLKLPEPPTVKQ